MNKTAFLQNYFYTTGTADLPCLHQIRNFGWYYTKLLTFTSNFSSTRDRGEDTRRRIRRIFRGPTIIVKIKITHFF